MWGKKTRAKSQLPGHVILGKLPKTSEHRSPAEAQMLTIPEMPKAQSQGDHGLFNTQFSPVTTVLLPGSGSWSQPKTTQLLLTCCSSMSLSSLSQLLVGTLAISVPLTLVPNTYLMYSF